MSNKLFAGNNNDLCFEVMEPNKRRILVVDDEPDITSIFKISLEYNGFEVDAYNDPILALSNFKAAFYGLMLLDIKMPGMTGFELYKEVMKIDNKVKVCFVTAYDLSYDEFRQQVPTLNAKCFLRKPILIPDLIKRIDLELSHNNKQ
jgi:two-component system, OmpR family, response regulator ChvI